RDRGPRPLQDPRPPSSGRPRHPLDPEELEHPVPGVGGVVGAVGGPLGRVDEPVLGALVDNDLAVVAAGPRGTQRRDVLGWGERADRAEDRQRRAGRGRRRERLGQRGPAPVLGHADHSVEATARSKRSAAAALSAYMPPMQKPITATRTTSSWTTT